LVVLVLLEVGEQVSQVGVAERPDRHTGLLVVAGRPAAVGIRARRGHGLASSLLARGALRAGTATTMMRLGSGRVRQLVAERRRAGLGGVLVAGAVAAALLGVDPADPRAAGLPPRRPLRRLAGLGSQRPLRIGDLVGVAVVLDGGGGLPPGPPPAGRLGHQAQRFPDVLGVALLQGDAVGAPLRLDRRDQKIGQASPKQRPR
jgi:hypothetical protein